MNLRSWPLLVAVALALSASVASAGTTDIVLQADGTYYNVATHQKCDADGNVLQTEANPFYDLTSEKIIITNAALTAGSADSCAAFDNHRNTLGVLALKIVPIWAAQSVADYAIQVRYHYLGATDSSSVFPILPLMGQPAADTTTTKTFGRAGQYFNGSSVLPYPSEFVVHLAKANITGAYSQPQMYSMAIALPQYYGLGVTPTYISFRIRNINGPTAAVTAYYTSGP